MNLFSYRRLSLPQEPRDLGGIASFVAVLVVSIGASLALDAWLVLPIAVGLAFLAGVVIVPDTYAESETREERRLVGEHLDRQVRLSRKVSILDPQTALLHRWYFELRVAEEARRCHRYGTSMALLWLDLSDHADAETPWQPAGEMDFVQLFARNLRSVDLAAKVDDRLFAVCLPHTTESGAAAAFERLLAHASAYNVIPTLATCPRDGTDYESLLSKARSLRQAGSADAPGDFAGLVSMVAESASGRVPLGATQKAGSVKSRLRRAAKRAGVELRIWEDGGSIWFERVSSDMSAA